MSRVRTLAVTVLLLAFAGVAEASWYDDYDKGLAAVRSGNWGAVVQNMSAAIKGNRTESNKARTYGAIFINYHPFYYRGVAYLNLGKYEQAIADLEQTSGPGPENLGSIESHMDRAKKQLQSSPDPEPAPAPVRIPPTATAPAPTPVQQTPQIDPALRQRATTAIGAAKQKLTAAQQRRATASPQYTNAVSMFTEASTRHAAARTNDDFSAIITMAENAGDLADLATAPAVVTAPPPSLNPSTPVIPKTTAATDAVLDDYKRQLRRALESYFAGDFDDAARGFESLSRKLPDNGWIWAFLGASQYSQYAFEADEAYRRSALRSFQKAKQLRSWRGGLPEKYFSRRIRNAFRDTAG